MRNVLCLTGDHQIFGNQKEAKNVFDLDSIQELMVLRSMRDEGKTWGGDVLETAPQLYLGAVENPFGDPFEFRVPRLAKKIAAGVGGAGKTPAAVSIRTDGRSVRTKDPRRSLEYVRF